MSHISAIFGTDDDQEILNSLYIIANVCYIVFLTGSLLTLILIEHKWTRPYSRISVDIQFYDVHQELVRLGK